MTAVWPPVAVPGAGATVADVVPDLAAGAPNGAPDIAGVPNGTVVSGPTLVTLSTVVAERVSWLWPGRLPAGKLVVLDGDPAVGKSTLSVDLAARISTGATWPDGASCPAGQVVVLSAEDGLADTIRPRLDAAGADPTRVHALTEVRYVDDEGRLRSRSVTLADAGLIEQAVVRVGATLVVVDVLMAYLPGKVDSHRDQDIRGVLSGLAALAERTGCCILLLRHLNKATGGNPLYRGGGSIGIVGAARAAMLAAADPDDDGRRVLAVTKSNLAAMPGALGYRLVDSPEHGCARVEWLGATDHLAADLLGRHEAEDDRTDRDAAGEWLVELLRDGPVKAGEVYRAADAAGLSKDQAKRAKKKLDVVAAKAGMDGPWLWSLPEGSTEGSEGSALSEPAPFAPFPLPSGPEIGPCTRCSHLCRRYGDDAGPLCASCRTVPRGDEPMTSPPSIEPWPPARMPSRAELAGIR